MSARSSLWWPLCLSCCGFSSTPPADACGPRLALDRGELLTIFIMLWVVGVLPQWGWSDYWIAIIGSPFYLATPENQWSDMLFPYLPWRVFPDSSPRVLDGFWMGLPQGTAVPWDGWVEAIIQWMGASLGMVVFGFCLVVLFQRQWMEAEKLAFPLAQMPLDLTKGFDGPRRVPDLFCSGLFWIGCGVVLLPLLYSIGAYFTRACRCLNSIPSASTSNCPNLSRD